MEFAVKLIKSAGVAYIVLFGFGINEIAFCQIEVMAAVVFIKAIVPGSFAAFQIFDPVFYGFGSVHLENTAVLIEKHTFVGA
jgi:hypothetical protein